MEGIKIHSSYKYDEETKESTLVVNCSGIKTYVRAVTNAIGKVLANIEMEQKLGGTD